MRSKSVAVLMIASVLFALGGCGKSGPTYAAVKEDAISSLNEIIAVIPSPKEVSYQPESDPYPCDDPLLPSGLKGAFFTGHVLVYVTEGFDIPAFIEALPGLLGNDWAKRDPAIEVSFANVDMLYRPLGLTVSVEDALSIDRPALELLVISRCGILGGQDKTPTPTAGGSPPPMRDVS